MPEIRTAYLFAAKIATIFEATKFVAHNFLFNGRAIIVLQKNVRPKSIKGLRTLRPLGTLRTLGTLATRL